MHISIGSPPRVRGTVQNQRDWRRYMRITPACAGNSPAAGPPLAPAADHPRVCGEQMTVISGRKCLEGSPPRVRGTDGRVDCGLACTGITPACAGNSIMLYPPRLCDLGSPPRVRGTVGHDHWFAVTNRITPACAGNRAPRSPPAPPDPDHPRVCGEQRLRLNMPTPP